MKLHVCGGIQRWFAQRLRYIDLHALIPPDLELPMVVWRRGMTLNRSPAASGIAWLRLGEFHSSSSFRRSSFPK